MNFDESRRIFHTSYLFADVVFIVYVWLLCLYIIGHVRRKEKMASGEIMIGTMSGLNCTGRSMTGEEAGVRAGARAEA